MKSLGEPGRLGQPVRDNETVEAEVVEEVALDMELSELLLGDLLNVGAIDCAGDCGRGVGEKLGICTSLLTTTSER